MKGHEYIVQFLPKVISALPKHSYMVEIGSERGQGSTLALAQLCLANGMQFISVDVDPAISDDAKTIVKAISPSFETVCEYGEKYLETTDKTFHMVYLDAFDFWHPNHSKERIDAYASRGTTITDDNAAAMHLACAKALKRCLAIGGYVCFDDILTPAPEWKGKGRDAIPWLMENGFELLEWRKQAAMLQRKS